MSRLIASLTLILSLLPLSAAERRVPTVDDLLTIKSIGGPQISPDGTRVVFTQTEADFKQDAFVTQLWLADVKSGGTLQLTRGDKSSNNPQWSADGKWIAFTSPRAGDRNQLFLIDPRGGEAIQITKSETAINSFSWAPDGKTIAYSAPEALTAGTEGPQGAARRLRGRAARVSARSSLDGRRGRGDEGARRRESRGRAARTSTSGRSRGRPTAKTIAFAATTNPDLINGSSSDIYTLRLDGDDVKKIVSQPGADTNPEWSPDGQQIVFSSAMGRELSFAKISRLAVVPAGGGTPRSLTDGFDEIPSVVAWNANGLYFSALQKTAGHLFRMNPATGAIARVSSPDELMGGGVQPRSRRPARGVHGRLACHSAGALRLRHRRLRTESPDQHDGAGGGADRRHSRAGLVEEQGRRGDRRRVDQAGRLRSVEEVSAALHHSRRADRHRSPDPAGGDAHLPGRHLRRPRRARAEGELSRQRRLRREVPQPQRRQPRGRRRVGRPVGDRSPDREGLGRSGENRLAWDGARVATSRRS